MLPRKKITFGDVAIIVPRGAKLSPWHLNPVHNIGHDYPLRPPPPCPTKPPIVVNVGSRRRRTRRLGAYHSLPEVRA